LAWCQHQRERRRWQRARASCAQCALGLHHYGAYTTSPGTATAGSDYTTTSGTLTFAPSQTSLNVSIPILNDATVEPNETVNLTLSSPTNASLGSPNLATLTIVDNDGGATGGDEYYQYDALGDLLQKGATAYSYGATAASCVAGTPASKPHAATSAGAASYTYDCDGNMLSGGGRTGMLWDTENRLTSVTNSSVTETSGYDADGERITGTSGVVTTVYLGRLWEETSAGAVKQYDAFNGTVVAVRDSSAGVSYLHVDHLGSVSATSGATSSPQTFGPWGNVTSGGTSATARNYTGQYLDSASGLLYYHARYYDATLARFISADTIVPGQTATSGTPNPQQLNRYSYVANNPLTTNDPSGHDDEMGSEINGAAGGGTAGGSSSGSGTGSGSSGASDPNIFYETIQNFAANAQNLAENVIQNVLNATTQEAFEGALNKAGVGYNPPTASSGSANDPKYTLPDYPGVEVRLHVSDEGVVKNYRFGINVAASDGDPRFVSGEGWVQSEANAARMQAADKAMTATYREAKQDYTGKRAWNAGYVDPTGHAYVGAQGGPVGLASNAGHIVPH